MQTAARGKATHNSTSTWINALETFRKDIGLPGKIDDVNSKEELERQLVLFFVSCKQQNGAEYSVQSIKSARFAIARHINTYSKIRPQEITNKNIYSELYNAITGKIKLLTDQGLGEIHGADAFTQDEIRKIINHPTMQPDSPKGLIRRIFWHNAFELALRGGEHYNLKIQQFKKRKDGGIDVTFYRSKCNQRSLIYTANWKNTLTIHVIKRFRNDSMRDMKEIIINEVYLMGMVNRHPNIIKIYGVTKFKDEPNYSLVLEYADSGTLGKYLKNNITTFKWQDQMKFANEMASAILCLHDNEIIHGDLHPSNVLIHQRTIKIADFGCSRLHGSVINKKEKPYGVMRYMDPKILKDHSYDLTKKSDIYSLAVLLWQLTSCKLPFESETDDDVLKICIINGKREIPIKETNDEYVELYQKCWEFEPKDRPDISEIVSTLKSINSEKNKTIKSEENEITKELENDNLSCQIRNY
ncbi:kinase-like protein [Rhizophagus irregularis]|uniref:Kinase-like protein n=6 Tax=Rhizophagus irregularis TaxID=588596 RepID=A0A2N0PIX8_9GLOM|nr:kinase-like protein [Rhizophagus irregularis]